jgi:hypothetical protein
MIFIYINPNQTVLMYYLIILLNMVIVKLYHLLAIFIFFHILFRFLLYFLYLT